VRFDRRTPAEKKYFGATTDLVKLKL